LGADYPISARELPSLVVATMREDRPYRSDGDHNLCVSIERVVQDRKSDGGIALQWRFGGTEFIPSDLP
jgi:hypothetical protein